MDMMYTMYYFENNRLCTKKINDLSETKGFNIYCVKDMTGTIVVDYREYWR